MRKGIIRSDVNMILTGKIGERYISSRLPVKVVYNSKTGNYRLHFESTDGVLKKPVYMDYNPLTDKGRKDEIRTEIDSYLKERIKESVSEKFDDVNAADISMNCWVPDESTEEISTFDGANALIESAVNKSKSTEKLVRDAYRKAAGRTARNATLIGLLAVGGGGYAINELYVEPIKQDAQNKEIFLDELAPHLPETPEVKSIIEDIDNYGVSLDGWYVIEDSDGSSDVIKE